MFWRTKVSFLCWGVKATNKVDGLFTSNVMDLILGIAVLVLSRDVICKFLHCSVNSRYTKDMYVIKCDVHHWALFYEWVECLEKVRVLFS